MKKVNNKHIHCLIKLLSYDVKISALFSYIDREWCTIDEVLIAINKKLLRDDMIMTFKFLLITILVFLWLTVIVSLIIEV